MLEIEDQLGRYGEALERELLDRSEVAPAVRMVRPQRSLRALVGVTLLLAIAGLGAIVFATSRNNDSVVATGPAEPANQPRAGVFSTATNTVLLVSDGIDGATAIDLDHRLAGRRTIEGERAGDQPFRLTLTAEHLVVGWGEIYAAPLSGEPSSKIADATIYIPAAEPGEVWTLSWAGGRIGAGAVVLERVTVNGKVTFTSTEFDASRFQAVIGVPGGLVVNTPEGVAVWDAATGSTGPVLGTGPATSATTDGRSLAWCESSCSTIHVIDLASTGPPTAPHVAAGQQIAVSENGTHIAALRSVGSSAELVIIDKSTSEEVVVGRDLDSFGAVQWTLDSQQLFYIEPSYRKSSMRIGRYAIGTQQWEIETLPFGDGFAAITVEPLQAQSFFAGSLVPATDCRGGGAVYPSGRQGVCTFAFYTPDSPEDCVPSGPRVVQVPDATGLTWTDAAILMQRAGLHVVAAPSDLVDLDTVVHAQEPAAGTQVPKRACIGLNTGT